MKKIILATSGKEKFLTYEEICRSGKTNMFSIGTVIALSKGKLDREDCLDIMRNYSKYEKEFLNI